MPIPDLCIQSLFFPGNIPASSGTTPTIPSDFVPSLDFSNSLNSQNIAVVS